MKKIIIFVALVLALCATFIGCSPKIDVSAPITHKGEGIELTLPRFMRSEEVDGYDMYFSNLSVTLTVNAVTEEMLRALDLDTNATRDEYFNRMLEVNSLERDKLENLNDDPDNSRISFSYVYRDTTDDVEINTFMYVVLIGKSGNLYYVSMSCDAREGENNLVMFNDWRRSIKLIPKDAPK